MALPPDSVLLKIMQNWKDDLDNGYDKVIGIFGSEGKGKSESLALPIIDAWYTQILGRDEIPPGRFCVDFADFGKILTTGKEYDLCLADEAGDSLYKKDHAKKFNKILYKAYTIIRGKRFLTIIVMPSFFDLDSSFRKRRMAGAFHVTRRVSNRCKKCNMSFVGDACIKCGSTEYIKGFINYKYYTKDMLEKINEINKNSVIPKMGVVKGISGKNSKYEGPLIAEYRPMKQAKMEQSLAEVKEALSDFEETGLAKWRKCPNCGSGEIRFAKGSYKCRNCPCLWDTSPEELAYIKKTGGRVAE